MGAEQIMTPTTVKYLYESGKRVTDRHKKKKHHHFKSAEDALAAFFAKLAFSAGGLKPRISVPGASQSVGKFTSKPGMPGTMATSRIAKPSAPGVKTVKPVDSVVDPGVSAKNAIRKNTPATKPQGLSGEGPMNTGL